MPTKNYSIKPENIATDEEKEEQEKHADEIKAYYERRKSSPASVLVDPIDRMAIEFMEVNMARISAMAMLMNPSLEVSQFESKRTKMLWKRKYKRNKLFYTFWHEI